MRTILDLVNGSHVHQLDERRVEDMTDRLRQSGHRLTPQRLAVIRILAGTVEHPSVDQLHSQVREVQSGTGLATVYNTVELLHELGEILVLDFGEGFKRYDGRRPDPHPHVICARCGRVDDIDGISLVDLTQSVAQCTGFVLTTLQLDLKGICPDCQIQQQSIFRVDHVTD